MKRVVKKLVASVLALALLMTPGMAFADESVATVVGSNYETPRFVGVSNETPLVTSNYVSGQYYDYRNSDLDVLSGNFYTKTKDYISGSNYSTGNDYLSGSNYSTGNDYLSGSNYSTNNDYLSGINYSTGNDYLSGSNYNTNNDFLSGSNYSFDNNYVSGQIYDFDYDVVSGDYCDFLDDVIQSAYVTEETEEEKEEFIDEWEDIIEKGFNDFQKYEPSTTVTESDKQPVADESWKNDKPTVDVYPQIITSNNIFTTTITPDTAITVPEKNTPTNVTYYMDVEVGRLAHISPEKQIHTTLTSSDTSILSTPYRREQGDYPSRAYKPGKATLSFYNEKDSHTENWVVNVYCRPLDFEKTEYVAEKKGDKPYEFIYLQLKNFEHSFEPSYEFKWKSSDSKVAEIYGGDPYSTFVRIRLKDQGASIITVTDKFGNSSSCVVIVKYNEEYYMNKASLNSKIKAKKGAITFSWKLSSDIDMDGYEVAISGNKGKTYSKTVTVKKPYATSYKYKSGKKNKVYYFKVRGYKVVDGKKIYTAWSNILNTKFKK